MMIFNMPTSYFHKTSFHYFEVFFFFKILVYELNLWSIHTAFTTYGAFTLDVKSVLNENLGGILGGTPVMLNER
jgi:hypothetical protein